MPAIALTDIAIPTQGCLVGRIWDPHSDGPCVVRVSGGMLEDISATFPTMRDLCEEANPAVSARRAVATNSWGLSEVAANTPEALRKTTKPWLLSPIDLQCVKAAGVTFAISMLERVIEERARGNPEAASDLRKTIGGLIGEDLSKLKPGSDAAMTLKQALIDKGWWSQYLEVGIGKDAEIFTKAPVLSSVGHGMDAGFNSVSTWNNPEPEVVLVISSSGQTVGATLGNDVNLRDVEGRSALLLGKAKDNNASAAIGPFIRLFDDTFTLDHVRAMELALEVHGPEGYVLKGSSSMSKISRDPADLVSQMIGAHHQYPDGAILYLGTLFAPVADRDEPGKGFTHKVGDIVTVSSKELGVLANRMVHSQDALPWVFGPSHLMRNLAKRGLLHTSST
jgi:fumarylacetoacetate (FAA) hydrolase family protein